MPRAAMSVATSAGDASRLEVVERALAIVLALVAVNGAGGNARLSRMRETWSAPRLVRVKTSARETWAPDRISTSRSRLAAWSTR